MGKLMIINGSPRAPISNSKKYADIFKGLWKGEIYEYNVTSKKHSEACKSALECSDLLFVFPLYADSLPVTLMHFLKEMEKHKFFIKPKVHVIINCGFIEPEQNNTACDMIRIFCKQNGFIEGAFLRIGSGEAILTTPFAFLIKRKIKRFVKYIINGKSVNMKTTMPLPKNVFLSASTKYWLTLGAKNGINKQQMESMKIE